MQVAHVAISQKICLDCNISVSEDWHDRAKVRDGQGVGVGHALSTRCHFPENLSGL